LRKTVGTAQRIRLGKGEFLQGEKKPKISWAKAKGAGTAISDLIRTREGRAPMKEKGSTKG